MPNDSPKPLESAFACPACHGAQYESVTVPVDLDRVFDTGVFRCTTCHFGFVSPQRYMKAAPR
jgi:hypothetical protein